MNGLTLAGVTVMREQRVIVREVSFAHRAGEMLALIGPNGAGKTTLLKAIAQLLPYQGHIQCFGEDLSRLALRQRARRIAYLSQHHEWSWPVAIGELVALGRYPHRSRWRNTNAQDRQVIERVLAQTGLLDLAERAFDKLSGGEQARALLARALAVEAPVLLIDEPVTSLDPHHQLRIMDLLQQHSQQGHTVIVVLHDLTLASRFCQRLILMDQGTIVADGSVGEVLTPENLREIYGVSAMSGEYLQQSYVLPWRYHESHKPIQNKRKSCADQN